MTKKGKKNRRHASNGEERERESDSSEEGDVHLRLLNLVVGSDHGHRGEYGVMQSRRVLT